MRSACGHGGAGCRCRRLVLVARRDGIMRLGHGSAATPSACPDTPQPGDLLVGRIADVRGWLAGLDPADLSDRDRVRVVAAVEELAAAAAGVQARMTAAYADSQRSLGCSVRG